MTIECITGSAAYDEDGLISFVVTHSDGTDEHRQGSLIEVSRVAATAGLHLMNATPGSFRWARS
jgi:hypothetical protein